MGRSVPTVPLSLSHFMNVLSFKEFILFTYRQIYHTLTCEWFVWDKNICTMIFLKDVVLAAINSVEEALQFPSITTLIDTFLLLKSLYSAFLWINPRTVFVKIYILNFLYFLNKSKIFYSFRQILDGRKCCKCSLCEVFSTQTPTAIKPNKEQHFSIKKNQ